MNPSQAHTPANAKEYMGVPLSIPAGAGFQYM